MTSVCGILGGRRETALGPAGLGDLVATGFSKYSRHRQVGGDLARSGRTRLESEGLISLPSVIALLGGKTREFPILTSLSSVVTEGQSARAVFEKLLPGTKKPR